MKSGGGNARASTSVPPRPDSPALVPNSENGYSRDSQMSRTSDLPTAAVVGRPFVKLPSAATAVIDFVRIVPSAGALVKPFDCLPAVIMFRASTLDEEGVT